ncbi:MAG: DUF3311 domain-containing protein [Candidatus Eremiobacteraeota bacterium]|nr:DUF3311 domain-containing protein [Candidatus Eremiobacteraeota bacterium]
MKRRAWYWLLVIPFIATLWPPFYVRTDPVVAGFPFFYWYQLVWIVLTALLLGLVLRMTREHRDV